MRAFESAIEKIEPLDDQAVVAAKDRQDKLTKPPGALGRLELIGIQLAGIARRCPPPLPHPASVAVFAGDHGVLKEGVSPWPQEVTAQMVDNFCAGGAGVSVLANFFGAQVLVVDVGVAQDLPPRPGLRLAKVAKGSGNIACEPAMTIEQAAMCLDIGVEVASELVDQAAACLITGDMGIGNTTPSAALIAAFTGLDAVDVTGRGTGISDEVLKRKVSVVEQALNRSRSEGASTPLELLASLGGLEIAALAGFILGGAAVRVPVVLDGVIAQAAALVSVGLAPLCSGYLIAGHRSKEPGSSAALQYLGKEPLLDLEMRLGEGSGACLALPIVQAAAKVLSEMATFEDAEVSTPIS